MLEITWLGHGTFQLKLGTGEVVILDPWTEGNPAYPEGFQIERVDIMLISHGHFDHIHDAVPLAKKFKPQVGAIFETIHWLESKGVENTKPMNKGGSQKIGPITVTMTHAVHSCGILDDGKIIYGGEAAGYVIRLDDGRNIYFAGDTNVFSDMALIEQLYHPELAFLPIGDLYTMSPREAALACRLLKVKQVVPMHFGTFPPLTGRPVELQDLIKDLPTKVMELEPRKARQLVKLLILGCGYTGKRVAARFRDVIETHRDTPLEEIRRHATRGVLVLHSTPPQGSAGLLEALGDAPSRVVYLSTTGVYGAAHVVDEKTAADPAHERIAEERRVAAGPWSSLILRPAGIYGPDRGIHERVRKGEPCEMSNSIVSRIHVEDLATHIEAALLSDITGAWPVADEEPCTAREMVEYCARVLNRPLPPARETRIHSNRRVDGSAIRRALGVKLRYPSYRVGVEAALRGLV